MNMIKVNFVPEGLRKEKGGLFDQGLGDMPKEVFVGIVVAAIAFLLAVHLLLGLAAVFKIAHQQVLQAKWKSMSTDKAVLDGLMSETRALQARMNTLKPFTSEGNMLWAGLLKDIAGSFRKGAWLRQLDYRKGLLVITGSAVSKTKGEMIVAYSIVSALKVRPSFKEYFSTLDIDSIQRRDNPALSVADFALKARRK